MAAMAASRRTRIVFALSGLAMALATVLPPQRSIGRDVVATVNGVAIPAVRLNVALSRSGASSDARREAIQRLVDEELLVQRAVEVGLVDSDRGIRKALARAMIDRAVREGAARHPTEAELRTFHATHAPLFRVPRRVRVRAISFLTGGERPDALLRAAEAAEAIASGVPFENARVRFGDAPGLPIPDAPLPEPVLRREIGPVLADAALALTAGSVSEPLRVGSDVHLLKLTEDEPARPLDFDAARPQVEAEWNRQRGDDTLAALLAQLRSAARIVRAPATPAL